MITRAFVTLGLGFGDEGKGATVDALVRRVGARLVVRYCGGPHAAHNVVTPDGRHHTFSQWGAGTLAGARTHLGPRMVVDPLLMGREAAMLETVGVDEPFGLLSVDERCPVIAPYQRAAARARERTLRHGSCGSGQGEVMRDLADGRTVVRVRDLSEPSLLRAMLAAMQHQKQVEVGPLGLTRPEWEALNADPDALADCYAREIRRLHVRRGLPAVDGPLVLEGAHGVLLDEWHGFHPHTTWATCTFEHADELLDEAGVARMNRVRVGCCRTVATRHGAGPLPSESADLTQRLRPTEVHNTTNVWQGPFRFGYFDAVLADYAVQVVNGVDVLALSGCDVPGWASQIVIAHEDASGTRHWSYAAAKQHDLTHQAELCRRLFEARPVVHASDAQAAGRLLMEAYAAPVGVLATGRTHEDREFTVGWTWGGVDENRGGDSGADGQQPTAGQEPAAAAR